MNCRSCGEENRDPAKFCGVCGQSLATTATRPGCGVENPPDRRFCDECGGPLTPATAFGS